VLFGVLDWKKRTSDVGTTEYWVEKAGQDKQTNQPVYLNVLRPEHRSKPVAHAETSQCLNEALLRADVLAGADHAGAVGIDAYSGDVLPLQDK
jgi:hypothetical protein